MVDQDKKPRGITAIAVSGFKSLRDETRIAIRPLTVLAGANSSGKSSIMQPLLLLKQTLEAPFDPGPLLLNGSNVRFTSASQFISSHPESEKIRSFSIGVEIGGSDFIESEFQRVIRTKEIKIIRTKYIVESREITITPNLSDSKIRKTLSDIQMNFETVVKDAVLSKDETGREVAVKWEAKRNRCFLGTGVYFDTKNGRTEGIYVDRGVDIFQKTITQIVHLPGLRGNPERSYQNTPVVGPNFQGVFQNYAASVINFWSEERNPHLDHLGSYMNRLGLTSNITTKRHEDANVEVHIGRTLSSTIHDTVNIADVGLGVSQVLPVLVALLVAQSGQLVYIEQPELHLHPRAQVALAQVLADAANRGVRVVIETHSDLVLLGIQTLVAEKKLANTDVIFHWFERDDEGCTKVTSTELDSFGRMEMSNFPEDFADVRFEAQGRFLDAVEITEADTESGD